MSNYLDLRGIKIVCDGNSITAGIGETPWPDQLKFMLSKVGINCDFVNVAVSGQTTIDMVTRAPTFVDSAYDKTRDNILIAKEGGNHILLLNVTAQQAYQSFRDYCIHRRSLGFYVVVLDSFKRSDTPGWGTNTAFEARLVEYNFLLRQNWRDFADAYVDVRKLCPQIEPLNQYMPDGLHPSGAGQALIAAGLISVLKKIPKRERRFEIMPVTYTFTTAGAIGDILIPSWCTRIAGFTVPGALGGGGGGKRPVNTAVFGGGGASGAGYVPFDFAISDLPGVIPGTTVISGQVGLGTNGGQGATANGGNGTNGVSGSASTISFLRIGSSGTNYIVFNNLFGAPGSGGTNTTGQAGNATVTVFQGANGGSSSGTAIPSNAVNSNFSAGGGGAGGGISSGNVAFAGGNGGRGMFHIESNRAITGTGGAIGTNGTNAGSLWNSNTIPGDGPGGGGGSITGNGGNGGLARAGSGGSGGGAARDGVGNGGNGSKGGDGLVQITFY